MDSISGVAVAPTTVRKQGALVGLAPVLGLLAGGAASWLAISVFNEPLSFLDWNVWEAGEIAGVSAVGALLAAWGVGAKSRGRNVPVAVLALAASMGWLVALPLSLRDAVRMYEALAYASDPQRLFGSGFSDSTTLRLIGVLLSAGVLVGLALGLARAAHLATPGRSARDTVRGLLLTSPVVALPVVAIATMPEYFYLASFLGVLSVLALTFLATGALAAPAMRAEDPRAAKLATGALWTGALGVVTGCVGLRATAYAAACTGMSNVDPEDLQILVNEHTLALGTMTLVTKTALLACAIPPALLALLAVRRGTRRLGLLAGALGALLLVPLLLKADALVAKYIDDQFQSGAPHPFDVRGER